MTETPEGPGTAAWPPPDDLTKAESPAKTHVPPWMEPQGPVAETVDEGLGAAAEPEPPIEAPPVPPSGRVQEMVSAVESSTFFDEGPRPSVLPADRHDVAAVEEDLTATTAETEPSTEAQTPVEAPPEPPVEAPVDAAVGMADRAAVEVPIDMVDQAAAEAPIDMVEQAPVEVSAETVDQTLVEPEVETPYEAPPVEAPGEYMPEEQPEAYVEPPIQLLEPLPGPEEEAPPPKKKRARKPKPSLKSRILKYAIIIGVVGAMVLAVSGVIGYRMGYGLPSQSDVTESFFQAIQKGELSLAREQWAAGSQKTFEQERGRLPASSIIDIDVYRVDRTSEEPGMSFAYVKLVTEAQGDVRYVVKLTRSGLGFKIVDVDFAWTRK